MSQNSRTFVLIHGAWHGGWCWDEVAKVLRDHGHRAFAPTQTGLAERAGLMSPAITLDTFIADVAEVIDKNGLHDVVLAGHSFGGSVVSGIADRMKERLRCLIYLDALMIEAGQTPGGQFPKDVQETRAKLAAANGGVSLPVPPASAFGVTDPAQAALLARKLTPHPYSTHGSTLNIRNKIGNGLPMTYIACVDPLYMPLQPSRDWVKRNGMPMRELRTGHDAMIIAPKPTAALFEELAG